MAADYDYTTAQCDVSDKRALQSYRDKRHLWLSWIGTDEHHAIWTVLSDMVWMVVSFKALTHFAIGDENNGLNNSLLGQALIDGHVATQVLAIRRLMGKRWGRPPHRLPMVRQKPEAEIDPWITDASPSLIASFTSGITNDLAAVRAAITEPWSNGQVEGHVNILKLVKRQL